jgi:tetratricopeptide (TPR) repeat protein
MRRILAGIVVFGVCLLAAAPARAGVYASFDAAIPYPANFQMNENLIMNLRSLPVMTPKQVEEKRAARDILMRYVTPFAPLQEQEQEGTLTTLDRIDLGACYIRRAKWEKAIHVLEAGDRTHFLILANLACAYQGMGRLDRAIDYQQQALKAWPSTWAWWSEEQRRWFRRGEGFYLTLLRVRAIEEARQRGQAVVVKTVDNLFNGVRFVGPSGEYEAGNLADGMLHRLPPDCIQIVYQLLFWNPADNRLHWLLGELLNGYARNPGDPQDPGKPPFAYTIFDDLVYKRGFGIEELKQHRRALLAASQMKFKKPEERLIFWHSLLSLADVQATPGGVAPALHRVGAVTVPLAFNDHQITLPAKQPPGDVSLSPSPAVRAVPSWKHIAVGFIAGAAFAALAALQLREWRRRQTHNHNVLLLDEQEPAATAATAAAPLAPSEQVQIDKGRSGMPGPG